MAEKQARAKGRNDQLKQQKRENFVVTPVFKMRDLVNNSNNEGRKKQHTSGIRNVSRRNDGHNNPNARTFDQRHNGGYRSLLAKAVQCDVIFNQGKASQTQAPKVPKYVMPIARLDLFRFCHILIGSIYGIEQ